MATTYHDVEVIVEGATWQVVCDVCGPVGRQQEYMADAEAICDRHREIQGTERLGGTP